MNGLNIMWIWVKKRALPIDVDGQRRGTAISGHGQVDAATWMELLKKVDWGGGAPASVDDARRKKKKEGRGKSEKRGLPSLFIRKQ